MLMDERFKEGSDDLPELLKDSFLQIQNLVEASDKMGKLSANLPRLPEMGRDEEKEGRKEGRVLGSYSF
eukprot:g32528.t1